MIWTLRLLGESLQFHQDKQPPSRRSLTSEDTARFTNWAGRYDRAVKARNHGELLQIGQEAFAWLEAEGHGWGGKLTGGAGPVCLDVVTDEDPAGGARAFLDVPWELLAKGNAHLAEDALRPFCVQRRLGEPRAPATPRYKDLAVMFMAAAPRNVEPVLDFEAEEAGILAATDNLPLALTVEESGCAAFLKDRLADDGPFEVMHLTCHGKIGKDGPILALENEGGDLSNASAATLADTLGSEKPGLLFLSACRSAEDGGDESAPLAILLTRAGVPAVLGWDGSVHDTDASHFAREMYAALAHHETPAFAVAKARQRLLATHRADAREGQHWHLARLYVGPEGGGALCAKHAKARPSHRGLAYRTFLGKERQQVPVAGPAAFVGRRRQLQDVFRAFRDPATPGVLIHGFGGQGKSSLAARVADRCPHHRVALVFKFYDAQAVFEQAQQAVIGAEAVALRDTWQPLIAKDVGNLKGALEAILNGPCADYELDSQGRVARQPLLLIIDDLEQILDKPAAGAGAKAALNAAHKPVLAAVLEAFAANTGQSRLLLTSRYDFALKNALDVDIAAPLGRVHLRPFDELERKKQQGAAARNEPAGDAAPSEAGTKAQADLLARCRAVAHGNPLVQATLTRTALAEPAAAEAALAKMEAYVAGGATPDEGELADVFKRLAFEVYRGALTKDEAEVFRALTLFELPVPENACRAAALLLAHEAAYAALARLHALGLTDRFEPYRKDGEVEALANALARPHFDALTEDERRTLAKAALPPVMAAWTDAGGDLPYDPRSLEAFHLATLASDATSLANAAWHGGRWLYDKRHSAEAALPVVRAALDALDATGVEPAPELLRLGIECADRLGEAKVLDEFLAKAGELKGADPRAQAMLQYYQANRLIQQGSLDEAQRMFEEARAAFIAAKDDHHTAVTMGKIADILMSRGDLDEALRIRREEALPVYERLGDVRERAVTMGKIADILMSRGDLDEALRIRREEQLPVYEKLKDIDGIIHVLWSCSRIRAAKGIGDQETFDRILKDLAQAYGLAKQLTRLDAICAVAGDLGQLLAAAGAVDQARPLITEARDGFVKLGLKEPAAQMDALVAQLSGGTPAET